MIDPVEIAHIPVDPLDVPALLHVVALRDATYDALGHDPRGAYVEQFWLPFLGPTTTWMARRLVTILDVLPDGFDAVVATLGQELGVRGNGRHSTINRAVLRLTQFDAARLSDDVLHVRTRLAPLNRRMAMQLPPTLKTRHKAYLAARCPGASSVT